MANKRIKWKVGDLFKVPLADETAVLGHVLAREREMMNSVTCAFYATKVPRTCPPNEPPMPTDDALIACVFTTHDLLRQGTWPIIGHVSPQVPQKFFPYEECRNKGWVGATMYGSGNILEFLNAFYCLVPWDDWADPNYLDELLISPEKRPSKLLLTRKTIS